MPPEGLTTAATLRAAIESAPHILDDTVADVTDDVANHPALDKGLPLAQRQAGWTRLQPAYLSIGDHEARELVLGNTD